ncbi:MAG: flagellar hook-associated protein FlgK, partial [Janthinobacterium sp.]
MTSNLLSIGKSGLLAAQVGLSTTGHNITNANVAGYNRQVVLQQTSQSNFAGYGFVGTGTEVSQIKRQYDSFMATQVNAAQSATSALDTYYTQISQIDNLLADPTAGLSPAMQDFFKGVQDFSANPSSVASRQALLSSAGSLASRFQGLSARLTEIGDGVNSQITSNVTVINTYAKQLAELNKSISQLSVDASNQPNDLLDQRDQLITELNKYVKATVQPAANNTVTISIGAGQPLVVADRSFELAATPSRTDPNRIEVGYVTGSTVT